MDNTLSGGNQNKIFWNFYEHLHTIHVCIEWTNKRVQDNKIVIFDIQNIRTSTGYSTTVCRKAATSDRYIHEEKTSAIRTLREH